MSQMQQQQTSIDQQYDQVSIKIQQLNSLLQKLTNNQSLDDLADQTTPQDYMNLLCTFLQQFKPHLFIVCIRLCFVILISKGNKCLKNLQFFILIIQKKVKQYFSKIKDTLSGKFNKKQQNPLQVDRQAAMRMIKAGIRQDPTQN